MWSDLNRRITCGQARYSAGTIMAHGAGVGPSPAADDGFDTVLGPFPAFGQATSGLACGWLQSPTLWWDRFAVAFWQRYSACLDLGTCIWSL